MEQKKKEKTPIISCLRSGEALNSSEGEEESQTPRRSFCLSPPAPSHPPKVSNFLQNLLTEVGSL